MFVYQTYPIPSFTGLLSVITPYLILNKHQHHLMITTLSYTPGGDNSYVVL